MPGNWASLLYQPALASDLVSNEANCPAKYLWYPVMAIIAALSVQYSNFGIWVFQPFLLPNSSKARRSPLLADTPPAIQISFICCPVAAFLSLCKRMEIILLWMEAQMSLRVSSTNCLLIFILSCKK